VSVRQRPRGTALAGVICLIVVVLVDLLLHHEHGVSGDEPFYVRMADHPDGAHTFPYAYRVALPWLVHTLPFSHAASFRLIAWSALGLSGATLFALLRDFDVEPQLSLGLALGTLLSPTLLVALLRHGRSVDPLSMLVVTLGVLCIIRRHRLALALVLAAGMAVKETTAFLVPFAYAVWAERLVDRRAAADTALVALAPFSVLVLLRAALSAVGSAYTPEYGGSFLHARWSVLRQAFTGVELRRLAYTYGPLWIAAACAVRRERFARRGLVLVVICAVALTVSFDTGRVLFIAAPVVVAAAALAVRRRPRWAVALVLTLFLLDGGYLAYMEAYGVHHGLDERAVTIPVR
jgi:hypothetical protein